MSHFLYYPNQACSLSDVAQKACIDASDADNYMQVLAAANRKDVKSLQSSTSPIILPNGNASNISPLRCTMQEHKRLAKLSHMVGGAGTMALADIVWDIAKDNATTFTGGAGASMAKTSSYLLDSIDDYQKQLSAYEELVGHRAPQATLAREEPKLRKAFDRMNKVLDNKGQQFLHKHAVKRRQTTNLNGRIMYKSIPITEHPYVNKLSHLAKVGKVVGPGMVLLDGFFRYDKVQKMYQANHPQWQRQAVVETTSFATGLMTAGMVASFVLFAIPGGLVVALIAGGVAAVLADKGTRIVTGKIYDGALR